MIFQILLGGAQISQSLDRFISVYLDNAVYELKGQPLTPLPIIRRVWKMVEITRIGGKFQGNFGVNKGSG